ncbi:MAG: hypothetical protein Kow0077_13820 [Anaerolineae bacterium]
MPVQHIPITRQAIDPARLDAELRAALGAVCLGLSAHAGRVTVHLSAEATPEQIARAEAIVRAHDPALPAPANDPDASIPDLLSTEPDTLEAQVAALDEQIFRRAVSRAFQQLQRRLPPG